MNENIATINNRSEVSSINIELLNQFKEVFGNTDDTIIVKSPASLTLLGDHTHYNDGILVTSALDKYSYVIMRRIKGYKFSLFFNCTKVPLDNLSDENYSFEGNTNARNIRKLFQSLLKKEIITSGVECVIRNDVPKCIGLGYYASTQIGLMLGLKKLFDLKYNDLELINLVHSIEKEYFGQVSNRANYFASLYAKENNLMLVDLRTNEYTPIHFDNNLYNIIICDTNLIIENSADICRRRIEECAVGVEGLKLYIWGIKNLRDVGIDFLKKHKNMIPNKVYKRCVYNVTEKQRVLNAAESLRKSDIRNFCKLIIDSYRSLKIDYELDFPEVSFLVNEALYIEGLMASKSISCTAAKSTYNIVRSSYSENFSKRINSKFSSNFGHKLTIINTRLTSRAEIIYSI